jgi:REP element-mobilizing transposase RayT
MADELPSRKSIRLKEFDYSSNQAYFVTACTAERRCLFGEQTNSDIRLNPLGFAVEETIRQLPVYYPHLTLDAFVVMPNHIHAILILEPELRAGLKPAPTSSTRHGLPEIMRALKTFSARSINQIRWCAGQPVWQRGYYEHVIRNERSLAFIRQYIVNNPVNWAADRDNPVASILEPKDAWLMGDGRV